jgi:hypothetical protein
MSDTLHIAICFGLRLDVPHARCSDHSSSCSICSGVLLFTKFEDLINDSHLFKKTHQLKPTAEADTMNMNSFTISTKGEPIQQKVIDTRNLTEEDLKTLRKQDPFLYFSIPAVRTATLLNRDVDIASLQGGQCSRRASCPSRIESTPPTKVERRTCISFECHTDLLLEDCFDEMANDDKLDSMFRQLQLLRREKNLHSEQ